MIPPTINYARKNTPSFSLEPFGLICGIKEWISLHHNVLTTVCSVATVSSNCFQYIRTYVDVGSRDHVKRGIIIRAYELSTVPYACRV